MLKDEDDFGSAAGEFGRTLHPAGENLKVEGPTVICEPDDILLKLGVADEVGLRREPVLRVGVPMQLHPHSAHAAIFSQAADETKGLGAMICFNGELHGAREVTKVHTSAVETFQSYHHGALGIVDGDRVIVYRRPEVRLHLRPERLSKRVELLKAAIGADGTMVEAVRQMGIDGLVVEAFGRGNVSAEFGQALCRVAATAYRSSLPRGAPSAASAPSMAEVVEAGVTSKTLAQSSPAILKGRKRDCS